MRVLIDTNVAVWLAQGARDRVSATAREALEDPATTRLGSAVSFWEKAFKRGLGRLELEAFEEGAALVSADARLARYGVRVVW